MIDFVNIITIIPNKTPLRHHGSIFIIQNLLLVFLCRHYLNYILHKNLHTHILCQYTLRKMRFLISLKPTKAKGEAIELRHIAGRP